MNIFATLPAGGFQASLIDANFAACAQLSANNSFSGPNTFSGGISTSGGSSPINFGTNTLAVGNTTVTGALSATSASDTIITAQRSGGATVELYSAATAGSLGTANSYPLQFFTNNTTQATLDTNGNLGLGVTPSAAWGTTYKALELTYGSFFGNTAGIGIYGNCFFSNTSQFIYKTSAAASQYQTYAGAHYWYNAPSGTAGNPITFTTVMTLDGSGNLTVPAMYATTVTTPRNVFIDSTGKMGGISSVRASKTNINPLAPTLFSTTQSPVIFNYRKLDVDGNYTDEFERELQYGLIAEDVEQSAKDFCIYVDGKLAGVHYDRMIAPLINDIKILSAQITTLQSRLTAANL